MNLLQLEQIIFSFHSSVLDKGHISRHRFFTSLPKVKGRIMARQTQLIFQPLHSGAKQHTFTLPASHLQASSAAAVVGFRFPSPSHSGCSPLPSPAPGQPPFPPHGKTLAHLTMRSSCSFIPRTTTVPTPWQDTGPSYHEIQRQLQLHPHRRLLAHKPEQRASKMSQRGANCCFIRHSWEVVEPSQLRPRPAAPTLDSPTQRLYEPWQLLSACGTGLIFVLSYQIFVSHCCWHNSTVF